MNLASQIERYLPSDVLELLQGIAGEAGRSGQSLYLVGGIVRDLLLGQANFDLDLVTEGDASELAARIAKITGAKLVTHPRFGTAKIKSGNFGIDIATARSETYSHPGALPTVSPGSILKDLFRRDFSINAMAVSLVAEHYGELLDPYHGRDDLDLRLIQVLHPGSFGDDATRILRAIRYEQRLGFELERETSRLLRQAIPLLDTISGDRVRHELELIFREEEPERALRRLGELGALQRINSALKGNGWLADRFATARRSSKPGELPLLYFCLLAYPLDEGEVSRLIKRLNMPARLAKTVQDAIRLKLYLPRLNEPHLKPSRVYQLLHEYHPLAVKANVIAADNAATRRHLELFLSKLRYIKPRLNGEELQRLGIPPGAKLGKILHELHRARLDGKVSTRDDEEKLALKLKQGQRTKKSQTKITKHNILGKSAQPAGQQEFPQR